jgi:putative tricarboxylic transport membrane protein
MKGDWWLAVCTIVGAAIYLYADWRIPDPVISDPLGPKVFPALIGAGLLGSGFLLLIETRKKRLASAPRAPAAADEPKRRLLLVGMAAWTVLYYTAFEPLGYVSATVVYLLGLLSFFNRGRHMTNVIVAIGFTAIAYAIFSKFLGVSMPRGPLGF